MNRPCRPVLRKLLTVMLMASMVCPALAADAVGAGAVTLCAVLVNGVQVAEFARLLRGADQRLLLARDVLVAARLRLPEHAVAQRDGEDFFALDELVGGQSHFDVQRQVLMITVPAEAFVVQRMDLNPAAPSGYSGQAFGGYLNYDVSYNQSSSGSYAAGLVEAVMSTSAGVLSSRHLAGNRDRSGLVRLDSSFVRDMPDQLTSLIIGDTVSGASSSGHQVYFGGVQWRRKFSLQPDYQPLPLPLMSGLATAPSLVDVYVDNVLRARHPVEAGPFSVSNLPVLSGQGMIQLVVNDVLGRQQIISQPYVVSPLLLKKGASDFSVEAGYQRFGFGTSDSHYGAPFGAATMRLGLSAGTVEGHGEATQDRQSVSAAYAMPLLDTHLLSIGAALGSSAYGTGRLGFMQLEHATGRTSYSGRIQVSNARMHALGLDDASVEPSRQVQAQVSQVLGSRVNASLGYLARFTARQPDVRALNASVGVALPQQTFFSVGMSRVPGFDDGWSINATLFASLGPNTFVQSSFFRQNGVDRALVEAQRVTPSGQGVGYRLRQTLLDQSGTDVAVSYSGDYGQVGASSSRLGLQKATQLQGRGGVAFLGGHVLPTRWIDDSFAVVDVPVAMPVDIYANNRRVGQTRNGIGIISSLVPNVANRVYLDGTNLPLDVSLDLNEKQVRPLSRTGLLLKFSARIASGATITLTDMQGQPLPPGTRVTVADGSTTYEIGLRGQLYLNNPAYPLRLQVQEKNLRCRVDIDPPAEVIVLPRLGPFACQPVAP